MDRKEAIRYISILLGGTLVGAEAFLSGCRSADKATFSKDDILYLNEIADTILPETSSPGAKAANVGAFMTIMIDDCYSNEEKIIFRNGMKQIDIEASKEYGRSFVKLSKEERHSLLIKLDKEQKEYTSKKKEDDPAHYFRMMKELTLLGYFSSEEGCTKARRYLPVPGSYVGCVDYKKGDKIIV
jgi:hypothetical protein